LEGLTRAITLRESHLHSRILPIRHALYPSVRHRSAFRNRVPIIAVTAGQVTRNFVSKSLYRCAGAPTRVAILINIHYVEKECVMNRDHIEGRIKELTGKVKEYWGKWNRDPHCEYAGKRDQRIGLLQKRRGQLQEHVGRQLDTFQDTNRDWDHPSRAKGQ